MVVPRWKDETQMKTTCFLCHSSQYSPVARIQTFLARRAEQSGLGEEISFFERLITRVDRFVLLCVSSRRSSIVTQLTTSCRHTSHREPIWFSAKRRWSADVHKGGWATEAPGDPGELDVDAIAGARMDRRTGDLGRKHTRLELLLPWAETLWMLGLAGMDSPGRAIRGIF